MRRRARGGRVLLLLAFVAVVATIGIVAVLSARGKLPPQVSKLIQFADGGLSLGLDDPPDASASVEAGPQPLPPGKPQTAPLSSAQLGAPLVHGTFVSACGAPATMKVKAKVTVKMGRAVAVTVKTDPPDPTIGACVEHAIRDLAWDRSYRAGTVTVSY
ncbi:MAG TPA: hypothetical protein VF765_24010 [Polyangiaceae bacterium]